MTPIGPQALNTHSLTLGICNLCERFALNVSVFVIVRSGEKLLLLRRATTGWKYGFYSLPAGGHDGSETLAAAAARELKEETSLHAEAHDMRLVHLLHCNKGDAGGEWLGAFFEAERWRGEPKLVESEQHDQIGWHALCDLPSNTILYTNQGIELSQQRVTFWVYDWPTLI